MATQRAMQRATSRLFFGQQSVSLAGSMLLRRHVATHAGSNSNILVKQRLNRPVAPHLSIYRPQITWFASGLNRITGVMLAGGLYLYSMAYLVGPTAGWHLESTVLATSFAAWPVAAKAFTKLAIAFPFSFHLWASMRNLSWTWGLGMAKTTVTRTGWAMVGVTVFSALYFALGY